jgi:NAD(P)-dependent dehydrogenase (short-subunit alcohol dehydrogenase family)
MISYPLLFAYQTPTLGIYCLSKAAIHSMTDTLRMELKPFGVDAMVVAPGMNNNHLLESENI